MSITTVNERALQRVGKCYSCDHRRQGLCALDAISIEAKARDPQAQCLAGAWGEPSPSMEVSRPGSPPGFGVALPELAREVKRNPRVPPRRFTGILPAVAVVIVSHNYGRFLADAIQSVLTQTVPAAEIVVIDDASTDETERVSRQFADQGVRYYRIEARDVNRARETGYRFTNAEILCFLDADDMLPPDHLESGLPLFRDIKTALVYGDMQQFGQRSDRVILNGENRSIHWENFAHAASLVRRSAILASGGFAGLPDMTRCAHHCDWALWRRVLTDGRTPAKQSSPLLYRQHGNNWLTKGRSEPASYYDRAALWQEPVTIYIPLSGRVQATNAVLSWVERQRHPHEWCKLVLLDTSQNDGFGRLVRQWLSTCDYQHTVYQQKRVGQRGCADLDARVPGNRAAITRAMYGVYSGLGAGEAEYILTVEDDMIPPDDAIERLFHGMDRDVFSVASPYRGRYSGWMTWDKPGHLVTDPRQGLQPTGGNGFGCTLLRRSILSEWAIGPYQGTDDYDIALYEWLRDHSKGRALVDWDTRSIHAGIAPA